MPKCPHCGYQFDGPDAVEIEREHENWCFGNIPEDEPLED